jgi:hypothetical protein
MWSPSTDRRRSGQIPANRRPGPAGRGRGTTLGSLRVDSCAWLGQGEGRRGGAPAAGGGGRRDRCTGGAAAPVGQGTIQEVGVEFHGGDNALNLVQSGLRP